MQSTSEINQFTLFPETLTKFAYQGFQQSKSLFSIAHQALRDSLSNTFVPETKKVTQTFSTEILLELEKRRSQLCEADWRDAQKGVYPIEILFDYPWQDFLRYYPEVWFDLPKVWLRWQQKQYQQFSPEIEQQDPRLLAERRWEYITKAHQNK